MISLVLTILINLVIVGYIAVREFGPELRSAQRIAMRDINLFWLVAAAACFLVALGMEYVKYRRMMMVTEGRFDRRGALQCAVLGKYYDNITPLGAGGQPFQIYYLKKRGLSTGASAAIPIAGFLALQFAFIILAAVVFIVNRSPAELSPVVRYSAYVGLVFYLAIPGAVVLFAILPRPFRAIVRGVLRFLGRLHIVKNVDATAEKLFASLDEYIGSLRLMNERPHFFLRMILCSIVYQAAILSIPFFVLRAFGGADDWWTVFSLVVYIYAAITIIPTPGNAGAAEGSFYAVFSNLSGGYLFWAMIIWRVLVYYSWLAGGLIVVARGALTGPGREKKKKPVPADGPLHIAQFCDIFYPSIDGVVRTVDAYARRMADRGNDVCVVCPKERGADDGDYPLTVFRTPSFRLPGFRFTVPLPFFSPRTRREFRSRGFHVFHTHSPFMVGWLAVRLGRRLGVPVVATFHSKYYDDALDTTHSRWLATIVKNLVVDFYCKVDEVWACSESTARTLREYGFRGPIHVMPNGVEVLPADALVGQAARAAEQFHIPRAARVLLFVGQLIWEKNLRLVLDTARLLADRKENYCTVIAGKGYRGEDREVYQYAERRGLGDAVVFTGEIAERALLYGLYERADLFFFPSIYDNAPLVLREAALCGTPALLARGSNAAEVIRDGENGFVAEPDAEAMAARIEEIFASGGLEEIGEQARRSIPVSWDVIVDRVLDGYRCGNVPLHGEEDDG